MEAVNYSYKRILAIALPILVSVLMEELIGMTDTAYLGRVGEVELGAAALGGIAYTVVFMLGLGFSIGVQIIIGRRNGEALTHPSAVCSITASSSCSSFPSSWWRSSFSLATA